MAVDRSYREALPLTLRQVREPGGPGRERARDAARALGTHGRKEGEGDDAHTSPWTKAPLADRRMDRRRRNSAAKRARKRNRGAA